MRHRSSFDISNGGSNNDGNIVNDDQEFDDRDDCQDAIHRPLLWNDRPDYSSEDDNDEGNDELHDENGPQHQQQHYESTAAICLCTFTHSWLLVSVFPYAGFMVIHLLKGTTEETVGTQAGLLSAAFMIGRAMTSYGWGRLADTYGRRIVLFLSLLLSAIFSILFGISRSFGMAFFWRFLLGASNGVAGIAKAIVSETAKGDDILETRGMSLSMGMWAWGFLFGPGISGFLSDPIRQYPKLDAWLWHDGIIYQTLEHFPFLLPNLVSILLCFIDIIAVQVWVPETLPKEHLRNPSLMANDCIYWFKKLTFSGIHGQNFAQQGNNHQWNANDGTAIDEPLPLISSNVKQARMTHSESVSLLSTSFPHTHDNSETMLVDQVHTDNTDSHHNVQEKPTLALFWSNRATRNHLLLYWIFSFVAIEIDEAFPLFCISKTGGLGISARDIGKLLSATGLIFALTQYHVYAWIVDKCGLGKSIQIGAFFSAPLVLLIPFSLILNSNNETEVSPETTTNTLTWQAFFFLGILLAICRIFGLVFFSSITIATNRTVIPCHRCTLNGLSMLGGSFAKGLGPIVAGWLTAFGISSGTFSPHVGAVFVFLTIGVSALITSCMTQYMLNEKVKDNYGTMIVDNTDTDGREVSDPVSQP
ncbi:major facilitator superfamily transporter [Nitzschia inconspicua]|uniref:Major facilitator superfamily transporter n=1 Tax=Nitzschia inconspicua TaxID=303405 RepID=A0A9K3LBF5_9STRA|nr:major facilitator superfamily transporter [Nitzschia inconspicua]